MQCNGELLVIKSLIQSGDTVFDVGAHKGEWSEYVSRHHNNVKMTLFEPIPHLYDALCKQYRQHNIFPYALSNHNEPGSFAYYAQEPALSSLYARESVTQQLKLQPKTITVKKMTLDAFCTEHSIDHVDFIKIDTEGSEYDILQGCKILMQSKAIGLIQFEYGGTYVDAHTTLKDVYDLLKNYEYSLYRIVSGGLIPIPFWFNELEDYQYANYLAVLSATKI